MLLSRRVMLAALVVGGSQPVLSDARRKSGIGDAVNVIEAGAKGDGIADDTDAIARAHSTNGPVFYPKPKVAYRISKSINISNDAIGEGSTIRLEQDGTSRHIILDVSPAAKSVKISGLVLEGGYDRGPSGEFSHGINLSGAQHVAISGNVIRNVRGDCVYIGSREARYSCDDILIENNTLENPYRCNVAVVCGSNVQIRRNHLSKQSDFVAAIDLEPNNNGYDFIRDVSVLDNVFDVSGYFFYATTADTKQRTRVTGLVIKGNRGQGKIFCRINAEAQVVSPVISENKFMATSRDGRMFLLAGVKGAQIRNNEDGTMCIWPGYRSSILYDSEVAMSGNHFCGQ